MIKVAELLAARSAAKVKKVQTIVAVDKTGMFFQIKSSTGKLYWWSIDQFEKDIKEGTKELVEGSDNEFITKGTDFSKLEVAS